MPLAPPLTDIGQLKDRPELAALLGWNINVVQAVRLDRDELTITLEQSAIREACSILRDDSAASCNLFCDLTCVDWYPSEPRFDIVYHLLSTQRKARVRLKVRLPNDEPRVESVVSVYPAANFYEREVFDLFGVRFEGHPYLRRIMMPEDWEGHPLRKDYPVEGYR